MTRINYHHGALRKALLAATLELIEAEGIGAVSLRKVARIAGVSPGAPYHHFADRAALVTALSDEGFRRLAESLGTVREKASSPAAALAAVLVEYVVFATTNPAYFRLMFRPELHSHKSQEGKASGEAAFEVLEQAVADCQKEKAHNQDSGEAVATTLWSTVHGVASLWLDGQLDHRTTNQGTTPEMMTKEIVELITKLATN